MISSFSFAVSTLQAVRRYFGISQQDMAYWLGLTQTQLSRYETSNRTLPGDAQSALDAWAPLLPAADAPLPAPELGAPERGPLEDRLDYCQHHARRLRRALRPLEDAAGIAARWRAAAPRLRATLPPDPGPEAEIDPATDWPGVLNQYRHRWLSHRPTALLPGQSAHYHLLRLQAEALETEAAALQQLLTTAVD